MFRKKFQLTASVAAAMEAVRRSVEFELNLSLDWVQFQAEPGKIEYCPSDMRHGSSQHRTVGVTGILQSLAGERYTIGRALAHVFNYLVGDKWEPVDRTCAIVQGPDGESRDLHVEWKRPVDSDNPEGTYDKYRAVPNKSNSHHPWACIREVGL